MLLNAAWMQMFKDKSNEWFSGTSMKRNNYVYFSPVFTQWPTLSFSSLQLLWMSLFLSSHNQTDCKSHLIANFGQRCPRVLSTPPPPSGTALIGQEDHSAREQYWVLLPWQPASMMHVGKKKALVVLFLRKMMALIQVTVKDVYEAGGYGLQLFALCINDACSVIHNTHWEDGVSIEMLTTWHSFTNVQDQTHPYLKFHSLVVSVNRLHLKVDADRADEWVAEGVVRISE